MQRWWASLSLRMRLLVPLLVLITGIWLVVAFSSFSFMRAGAQTVLDSHLQDVAAILGQTALHDAPDVPGGPLAYQVWQGSTLIKQVGHLPVEVVKVPTGFSTQVASADDHPWRVLKVAGASNTVVLVGRDSSQKEGLVDPLIDIVGWHLVIEMLAMLAIIVAAVSFALRPLGQLAGQLGRKNYFDLSPLPHNHVPHELKPLVQAINLLLARLDDAFAADKAFTALAAHELRTPLAALRLQAQVAQQARTKTERDELFAKLLEGVDRASHMVGQLLLMSRLESAPELQQVPTALDELVQNVLDELAPLATSQKVKFNIITLAKVKLKTDPTLLRILVRNVLDNAVRYSPAGGVVQLELVSIGRTGFSLTITDQGPGIPSAQMSKVFEKFYRVPGTQAAGSGLGLSLAKQVANILQLELTLQQAKTKGTFVRIQSRFKHF